MNPVFLPFYTSEQGLRRGQADPDSLIGCYTTKETEENIILNNTSNCTKLYQEIKELKHGTLSSSTQHFVEDVYILCLQTQILKYRCVVLHKPEQNSSVNLRYKKCAVKKDDNSLVIIRIYTP